MAKPVTKRWSALTLWVLGLGSSPLAYEALNCGLTAKSISFSTETGDVTVPDCSDPDAPAWTERAPRAHSATIQVSGVMAEETLTLWKSWFFGGDSLATKVILNTTTPIQITGNFVHQGFEITANLDDGKIQFSSTLVNDGTVTWT